MQQQDSNDEALDIQLHPFGVALIYNERVLDENLPGQLNLTNQELGELRDKVDEAWFIRWGLQRMSVAWKDVEAGDIIPSLGLILTGSPYPTDTDEAFGTAHFIGKGGKLTLPFNIEVTVHRRIQ